MFHEKSGRRLLYYSISEYGKSVAVLRIGISARRVSRMIYRRCTTCIELRVGHTLHDHAHNSTRSSDLSIPRYQDGEPMRQREKLACAGYVHTQLGYE